MNNYSNILLPVFLQWAYVFDEEFKQIVDNLTQKEIEDWNTFYKSCTRQHIQDLKQGCL